MKTLCNRQSNSRTNRDSPEGLVNPLDTPVNADEKHYNPNTHLLFNSDTQQLEIFGGTLTRIQTA